MTPESSCKAPNHEICRWRGLPELLGQNYRNSTLPSAPQGDTAGCGGANPGFPLERKNENQNTFEKLPVEQEATMGRHYICVC